MIKLLIVDDETIIREGMTNIIDWEKMGVRVVGTASNGRDGMAKAIAEKPDIVITDIRMPIIDGIRFSTQLREKFPKVKIIFLTGYSDFEYSRHAIHVGAEDYLLKPVNTQELIELVQRLTAEINQENQKVVDWSRKRALLKESLPMMREQCVRGFMDGILTQKQFTDRVLQLGMNLSEGDYRIMIFCIDYYFQLIANGERQIALLKFALANVAEEIFRPIGDCFICDDGEARQTVLLRSKGNTKEITRAAREIQFYMRKYYSLSVSVGIGTQVKNLEELRMSWQNADRALESRLKQGSGQIIVKEDYKGNAEGIEKIFITLSEEEALKDSVALLSKEEAFDTIEQIFEKYVMEQDAGRKETEQLTMYLILIGLREAEHSQLEPKDILGRDYYYYEEIFKYETAEDLEMWIKDIYSRIIEYAQKQKNGRYKGIVISGIAYAQEHFAESIQVSDVAKAVFVTPNYFSKVFKEETGENFTDWLNKYRISRAKKRIEKEPETKIYTIAAETGFNDYKYFAFIFKKYTGYTPTSYRNTFV